MLRFTVCAKLKVPKIGKYDDSYWADDRCRKGVFDLHPKCPVTLKDVRDAYDIHTYTNALNPKHKNIYEMLGCDKDMVDRYLEVVERLEKTYFNSPDERQIRRWYRPITSNNDMNSTNVYEGTLLLDKYVEHPEISEIYKAEDCKEVHLQYILYGSWALVVILIGIMFII